MLLPSSLLVGTLGRTLVRTSREQLLGRDEDEEEPLLLLTLGPLDERLDGTESPSRDELLLLSAFLVLSKSVKEDVPRAP